MVDVTKFSMGVTAASITSMGLIAGLQQGDSSKTGVVTGLLVVAVADNVSDSLGIHIYKESEGVSRQETMLTTLGNFAARLVLALTFVAIVLLLSSRTAFIVASVWGLSLLAILSYLIAKKRKASTLEEVALHLVIALVVIAGCRLLGNFIVRLMSHSVL
ncbi:MAG: hypothetical protein ABTD50_03065 [Polyangiaceae bacterium]|jgi:VIT1/CCC1 family predicted Fe2+/Mn2+ transporter